jgi:arylsulfatase A-like enzyme
MIDALKAEGLYESTLFVVTAKHGQSPINRATLNKPGHFADLVAALPVPTDSSAAAAQAAIATANACGTGPCGFVQDDDIALIWLADQTQAPAVAAYLNQHVKDLFIDEVLAGSELKLKFNDPQHDNRTPDVIVQPNYGVVYTGSTKKDAEHGGFSFADTNVGLIVSNPSIRGRVVKSPVATSQVAATILQALEIDPNELESVRVEGTEVLPGLSQH